MHRTPNHLTSSRPCTDIDQLPFRMGAVDVDAEHSSLLSSGIVVQLTVSVEIPNHRHGLLLHESLVLPPVKADAVGAPVLAFLENGSTETISCPRSQPEEARVGRGRIGFKPPVSILFPENKQDVVKAVRHRGRGADADYIEIVASLFGVAENSVVLAFQYVDKLIQPWSGHQ